MELRPDSHNPQYETIAIDLAKHILHIDGVAVGALIGRLGSVMPMKSEADKLSDARITATMSENRK